MEKGHTKRFVDKDGYTNIIHESPNSKMIIKYKGNSILYWYNSKLIYSGNYTEYTRKASINLDAELEKLDKSLDQLDKQLDDFDTIFDSNLPVPQPMGNVDLFKLGNQLNSQTSFSQSNTKSNHRNNKDDWKCCLGCVVFFIAFFIVLCVILYAMGNLGGELISFLTDLF